MNNIESWGLDYFGFQKGSFIPPIAARLQNFGGPIISQPAVVEVLWGSPSSANVYIDAFTNGESEKWYKNILKSPFIDWLAQYGTSSQKISRGSFVSRVAITPSPNAQSGTISDSQVQYELKKQLAKGKLPPPQTSNGFTNTIYVIHFPRQIDILNGLGLRTCLLICGYHGSFPYNNTYISYIVVPDMSHGGCPGGCVNSPGVNTWEKTQVVTSHELLESITDTRISELLRPNITFLPSNSSKLTYYDPIHGEIGDLCLNIYGTMVVNGITLYAQKGWSNYDNCCILSQDFSHAINPSSLTLTRGGTGNLTISLTQLGSSRQHVSISIQNVPAGITSTMHIPPNYISGTSTITLQASNASSLSSFKMQIKAQGHLYTKTVSVTVKLS